MVKQGHTIPIASVCYKVLHQEGSMSYQSLLQLKEVLQADTMSRNLLTRMQWQI